MVNLLKKIPTFPHSYISDADFEVLLGSTPDSRYGKIKRLLAQGKLLHIRRGLYCLTEELGCLIKPHPFELAQYIYGPSYISLESALSFHKLIPETVYTVTSATAKRSKEFRTPLGVYSYLHLPRENFYVEVERVQEDDRQFFMAKPWKAICDYVYCYRKDWTNLEPLLGSLRMNHDELPSLGVGELQQLQDYYHHRRLDLFLKGVHKKLSI